MNDSFPSISYNCRRTRLPFIFCVLEITALLTGCAPETASRPYRAEVLTMVPKQEHQSAKEEPQFQIKQVQFSFLEDLDSLTSKHINMKAGGTLVFTESLLNPGYSSVSFRDIETPQLLYSVRDGVIIPRDNFTLTILSTAYQFDTIISHLETLTGINPDDLLASQGKLNIYHEVAIDHYRPGQTMSEGNAAYLGGMYSIATLKTSPEERVPISTNLSILTHEYGHLLVDHMIKAFQPSEFFEEYDLKGFNEGFADLFAFTLTGNSNIIAGSLDLDPLSPHSVHRHRDFTDVDFSYAKNNCELGFYCIGVLFNHAYYKTLADMNLNANKIADRIQGLTKLVQALKKSAPQVRKMIPFKKRKQEFNPFGGKSYTEASLELFLAEVLKSYDDLDFRDQFRKNLESDFKPLLFDLEEKIKTNTSTVKKRQTDRKLYFNRAQ